MVTFLKTEIQCEALFRFCQNVFGFLSKGQEKRFQLILVFVEILI